MVKNPNMAKMVKSDKNGKKWSNMVEYGQKWSKVVKRLKKW